jgi:hypothetical protein
MSNEYNGWTNYETWRVNLEIFDGLDMDDVPSTIDNPYDLAEYLKEMADELVCGDAEGLARDYAHAFLSEVDYRQIATLMLEESEQ